MKKQIVLTIISVFLFSALFTQITNYDDVAVIVNDNSQVSLEIGAYFKQARNIPDVNMIHIRTLTDEEIDTIEFRNIQYQVKNYILSQGLQTKINYLVTTKGVPFDIVVDSCQIPGSFQKCSAVESELTLLLSPDSADIIENGFHQNPYFQAGGHFSSSDWGIFLVSRLDGYTKEDVFNMIDKSGPEKYVDKTLAQVIFDISYLSDTNILNLFVSHMQSAIDTLTAHGWNTWLHGDSTLPSNEGHVLGFVSFNYQPSNKVLDFSWEAGAFSQTGMTGPVFTFYDSLNPTNDLIPPNMISEGCAISSGWVHPYFASLITSYEILFGKYLSEEENPYNIAESYYMATRTLSYMNILIGDPKTTITTKGGNAVDEKHCLFEEFIVYPNPAGSQVTIRINSRSSTTALIRIFNQTGRVVSSDQKVAIAGRNEFLVPTDHLENGLYFISILDQSGAGQHSKLMVRH